MKKYYFVGIFAFLFTNITMGQVIKPEQVPSSIISAFQSKFPNAKDIEWEMDNSDFEVNFEIGKVEWSAKFDSGGKLLETEQEINVSQIPQNVRQAIESEYPNCKIEEAEQVTLADNSVVYEIEVEKDKKSFEVQVSIDGKILKKSEKTETDKEE
ncbi:MAG: hypothetical protein OHK0045_18910 [Raineya sp.]